VAVPDNTAGCSVNSASDLTHFFAFRRYWQLAIKPQTATRLTLKTVKIAFTLQNASRNVSKASRNGGVRFLLRDATGMLGSSCDSPIAAL
jgi:hypothetical protein